MSKILVKAAPGVEVPMEGAPRRYITGRESVQVEDSAYYRRRIADGDLELAAPKSASAIKKEKEAKDGQS